MKLPRSGSLITITSNKSEKKHGHLKTMLAIKFFIYNPEYSIPITYRLQLSLFKNMNWNKLIQKLHEITHNQFSGFILTWDDGFHNCIITDVKDIIKAIEYMQMNSLPKSLPNQNVSTTNSSKKSREYSELIFLFFFSMCTFSVQCSASKKYPRQLIIVV
ncbi:unnamed protein product [Schistosoma rodhaini]|uniref:Uncharacterized protein n=1 Tax=Schistosoma rodhaini TaxID=6188 RepID=A0AA85GH35_9TREM|nr:unnamed protein product [Schistosoma rodhaini]